MSIPSNISFVQKAIISFCLLAKALRHCIAGCQDSFRKIFCHFSARSRRSGTAWMHSYLQSGGTFQTFQSPTKYNMIAVQRSSFDHRSIPGNFQSMSLLVNLSQIISPTQRIKSNTEPRTSVWPKHVAPDSRAWDIMRYLKHVLVDRKESETCKFMTSPESFDWSIWRKQRKEIQLARLMVATFQDFEHLTNRGLGSQSLRSEISATWMGDNVAALQGRIK